MVLNLDEIWSKVLDLIKKEVATVNFGCWFKDAELIELKDDKIVLQVAMFVQKKTLLKEPYYSLITDSFLKVTGVERELECYLKDELNPQLEDTIVKIIDNNIENLNEEKFESNLKPDMNFDNFVVGDTNKFARTSALAVAENPGTQWNPLFIYGKSGLGKTHLMHAIGNYINKVHPELRVLYIPSEEFKMDVSGFANKTNGLNYANEFKNKYRNIDVLIIDDIQFLVNADKTQEEFFHTFEDLHGKNKQIIISSDRSPDDLQLLEERLKSRFNWGLSVDIYPPDFELRCRIIRDKIKNYHNIANKMSDEAIEFIANNFDTDVRALEGAINRVVAYTAMNPSETIDLSITSEALIDYVNKNIYNTNDISSIQKAVADYYNITVEVLKGKKRSANIVYPRMVAMYMCRMMTDQSFPRIGLEFGGRDHSTVIHAVDKIESDLKENSKLKEIMNEIKSNL